MVYLKHLKLLDDLEETKLLMYKKNIYNNIYPFKLFTEKEFRNIEFAPITIFYGGNGSGKTTLLNIIADKIRATKKNINNKGELFDSYVNRIFDYELVTRDLTEIKLISSDDVFDFLLDLRAINNRVNRRKEDLETEYQDYKYNPRETNLDNYQELKDIVDAKHKTLSTFIRTRLGNNNIIEQSNGESALDFFEREIQNHAIYLLDEPENSLSAENQIKLGEFILDSVRFYDCQFIISTHSPFLLSMLDAKIYDLDEVPVRPKKWTELKNVRVYYNFFNDHKDEFDE